MLAHFGPDGSGANSLPAAAIFGTIGRRFVEDVAGAGTDKDVGLFVVTFRLFLGTRPCSLVFGIFNFYQYVM